MHQSEFILEQTEQERLFPDHEIKKSQGEVLEQTRPGNFESYHQSTYHSSQNKLSVTEKEILSHDIIQEIVEKSRKKTVQHQINKIDKNVCLFAKPLDHQKEQYHFDEIPPKNPDYFSTCSKKIQDIHRRLSQDKDLSDRLTELANKNKQKCRTIKNYRSASENNIDKRVTLSGLISYNFNSVNARRSLGVIPDDPEDVALEKKVKRLQVKNSCSLDRKIKIMNRKPQAHTKQAIEVSKAVVCDFHTPTTKFLRVLGEEKKKRQKIYGQQMQKLACIKQYMEQENVPYDQAKHIVNQILQANKKEQPEKEVKKQKPVDEEELFGRRKQIARKRKVMVKHLYFVD